jgi:hypothetical protein
MSKPNTFTKDLDEQQLMSIEILREVVEKRKLAEAEEFVDYYDILGYDNWTDQWWEDPTEVTKECPYCKGTGIDRHVEADCLICFGEGYV